ncbi:MAG: thiamine phosphate synthase [Polyangiaceae bacterium]
MTDPKYGDDAIVECVERAATALPPGVLCVQLRDKVQTEERLRGLALRLRTATAKAEALLVINGYPRLARDVGADGVHLGGGACSVAEVRAAFMRSIWVSVAAHSDDEARRGADDGADAILVSPVFASPKKRARGLAAIQSARMAAGSRILIYALGGVTQEMAGACVEAGADGVAVIRALLASPDPAKTARSIYEALTRR